MPWARPPPMRLRTGRRPADMATEAPPCPIACFSLLGTFTSLKIAHAVEESECPSCHGRRTQPFQPFSTMSGDVPADVRRGDGENHIGVRLRALVAVKILPPEEVVVPLSSAVVSVPPASALDP